jgi:DNA-binding transcriptional MerR regulator
MNKKTFYTVKEVTEMLELNESTLRYYVSRFKINVPKRANRLAFSERHINKLRKIKKLANKESYKLEGVAKNLCLHEEENAQLSELSKRLEHIKKTLISVRSKI